MPEALGDILTVSIFIGRCVFYSPSFPCVCRHFAAVQCGYIYSRKNGGNTQAWRIKKRILRLKYLRSKYRLELWAWCKSNILYRNAQLFVRQFCEHTAQSVHSGGKLWIFVESRLEVIPVVNGQPTSMAIITMYNFCCRFPPIEVRCLSQNILVSGCGK